MMGTIMKRSDTGAMGPGEAAARLRQRRMLTNFGAIAAVGFVVGLTAALVESKDASILSGGTLPGWFAIMAAVLTVGAVGIGSWRYHRTMDELQRLDNYFAGTVGANLFLGGYPVWLILWKGGLVPEPNALVLYLAVWLTTVLAYTWRKLR